MMTGCEIWNSKNIKRASGCRVISAGSGYHSIYSDGLAIYFREGSSLCRLNEDRSVTIVDNGFPSPGGRTVFHTHYDRTYLSDGVRSRIIQGGSVRSWGIIPPGLPTVSNGAGSLISGRYHVGVTYLRNDGQESGTSGLAAVDSTGGVVVTVVASSDPGVSNICVYITSAGGDIPYLRAVLPNQNWSGPIALGIGSGRPLDTDFCSPPPPSTVFAEYKGRMYLASDDNIVFTRSGNQYEIIGPLDRSFIPLGEEPTNIMPVDDGIWVTTSSHSMFLQGSDPYEDKGLVVKFKRRLGGIKYSGRLVDADTVTSRVPLQGRVAIWSSGAGICLGAAGGYFKNITGDYFQPTSEDPGMSFVRNVRNLDQYIFGLGTSSLGSRLILPVANLNNTQ